MQTPCELLRTKNSRPSCWQSCCLHPEGTQNHNKLTPGAAERRLLFCCCHRVSFDYGKQTKIPYIILPKTKFFLKLLQQDLPVFAEYPLITCCRPQTGLAKEPLLKEQRDAQKCVCCAKRSGAETSPQATEGVALEYNLAEISSFSCPYNLSAFRNSDLCILTDERSTIASRLCWLFGLQAEECGFVLNTKLQQGSGHASFVARAVLGENGGQWHKSELTIVN